MVDQRIRGCPRGLAADDSSGGEVTAAPDPLGMRLIAGDEQVLTELWQTQVPAIERWLAGRFEGRLRPFEVEDVVAEALERLWESRASYDPARPLKSYFRAIAYNVARNRLKSPWHRQRRAERSLDPAKLAAIAKTQPDGGSATARNSRATSALAHAVRQELEHLPEAQRRILWGDACAREEVAASRDLAEELGVSESTVRGLRHRALRKLRWQLGFRPPPAGGR